MSWLAKPEQAALLMVIGTAIVLPRGVDIAGQEGLRRCVTEECRII